MGANGEAWAAAVEIKVLAWWQAKESKWPALAKMVKQYFAAPASSKGVERVFLAAGNMHGDLQKSAKDSTLDRWSTHSLRRSIQIEILKKTSLSFEGRLEAWRVGFNSWGKGRGATAYLAVSLGRVVCVGQRTSAINWHVEPVNWHGGFPKLST